MRPLRLIRSRCGLPAFYETYFLYGTRAVRVPLDSLFTGYGWRKVIADTLTAYEQAHPKLHTPCVDVSAWPELLRYRFLPSREGLYVFPEWDTRSTGAREYPVCIPWEKLSPYFRPGVREKLER